MQPIKKRWLCKVGNACYPKRKLQEAEGFSCFQKSWLCEWAGPLIEILAAERDMSISFLFSYYQLSPWCTT